MFSKQLNEGHILGLGNPLLDVTANVTEDFLQKFDLKANDAILAEEKHEALCKEMSEKFHVDYIAGGAAQNSMRVAQWFFKEPRRTAFFGSVGGDTFGEEMRQKAEQQNVIVSYNVDQSVPTGTCACLITGKNRSLCAYLGASQQFNITHVEDNFDLVRNARIVYTTGFHSMVCFEAQKRIAEFVHSAPETEGRIFSMNLSAPYIPGICASQFEILLPYVDLLFGNETEAQAFSTLKQWNTNNVAEIAQLLADMSHLKGARIVVLTQGSDDILVAFTNKPDAFLRFPVARLKTEDIVDTNGAGDSFVGGFLAYRALGKSLAQCIEAGIYAATEVIRMSGCTFPSVNQMSL